MLKWIKGVKDREKKYLELQGIVCSLQAEIEKLRIKVRKLEEVEKIVDDNIDKIAYLQGKLNSLTDRAATARQDIDYLMFSIGELRNKK